jgi:hypothetical protein
VNEEEIKKELEEGEEVDDVVKNEESGTNEVENEEVVDEDDVEKEEEEEASVDIPVKKSKKSREVAVTPRERSARNSTGRENASNINSNNNHTNNNSSSSNNNTVIELYTLRLLAEKGVSIQTEYTVKEECVSVDQEEDEAGHKPHFEFTKK